MLWANFHLLFWLSLVPFFTGWMDETQFATPPVVAYGVDLLMAAVAYYILEQTLIAAEGNVSRVRAAVGADVKGWVSVGCYIAGILAALLLSPWVGIALYAVVAAMWFVPDRRIERALGSTLSDE